MSFVWSQDYSDETQYSSHLHFSIEYDAPTNTTTNTNASRTIGEIYLRRAANIQEGHEILDIQRKRVVSRSKVTPLPMAKQVIAFVERWGTKEGFTSLKFYDRKRHEIPDVVLDADLTAGENNTYLDIDWDYEEDHVEENDARLTGVDDIDQQ